MKTQKITLNSLVYYIIRDITLDFKQYDSNDTTKYCHIFKYLKKIPLLILKQLYNDFIKTGIYTNDISNNSSQDFNIIRIL